MPVVTQSNWRIVSLIPLKSEPRFLKFLEKQGLRLDGNGNIVEKEQQE